MKEYKYTIILDPDRIPKREDTQSPYPLSLDVSHKVRQSRRPSLWQRTLFVSISRRSVPTVSQYLKNTNIHRQSSSRSLHN